MRQRRKWDKMMCWTTGTGHGWVSVVHDARGHSWEVVLVEVDGVAAHGLERTLMAAKHAGMAAHDAALRKLAKARGGA